MGQDELNTVRFDSLKRHAKPSNAEQGQLFKHFCRILANSFVGGFFVGNSMFYRANVPHGTKGANGFFRCILAIPLTKTQG